MVRCIEKRYMTTVLEEIDERNLFSRRRWGKNSRKEVNRIKCEKRERERAIGRYKIIVELERSNKV